MSSRAWTITYRAAVVALLAFIAWNVWRVAEWRGEVWVSGSVDARIVR